MTTKKTTSTTRSESNAPQDAIALLTDDHKRVKKLFKDFEKLSDSDDTAQKEEIVEQICLELTVHAEVEEELFYPAVRASIDDQDLVNEAEVEHASAKDLIAQLQTMESSDPMYDAKVTVLGEYIDHHVKEEEGEMFPKAKKAKMDLEALGEQMAGRKEELMASMEGGAGIRATGERTGAGKSASR